MLSINLLIARAVSPNDALPRRAMVTEFKAMSPTASVIDATATAKTSPPKEDDSLMKTEAAKPANPATSARENVQMTQRR